MPSSDDLPPQKFLRSFPAFVLIYDALAHKSARD